MTIDDMRRRIQNDDETKMLDIPDHMLYRVIEYLDLKMNHDDSKGYRPILVTDPYITIEYVPTDQQKKFNESEALKSYLKVFDSDLFIQNASLEDFEIKNDKRRIAYEYAKTFIDSPFKEFKVKGLYLAGPYQKGKTYLLSAIAHELAKRKYKVLFVFMPELVRNMKEAIQNRTLDEKVNALKQADVLILDDLGGENLTVWFRDEILMPVIQYRLYANLPIFISSNMEMKDLLRHFSSSDQDNLKAGRLVERIRDMTTYVTFI